MIQRITLEPPVLWKALSANISETLALPEFSVEGGEGRTKRMIKVICLTLEF